MQAMTRTMLAAVIGLTFMASSSAMAKDVHDGVADLSGVKQITVKKNAVLTKKKSKSGVTTLVMTSAGGVSQHVAEFLYLGHDELLVIDEDGARPVNMVFGGESFSWDGADGLTYVIESYPHANDHARVAGKVFDGFQLVGRMGITHLADGPTPAAGSWDGTLAFAGGAMLPLSLRIAQIPQVVGECASYHTRIQYPGRPYEDTSLSVCKDAPGTFHAGFFYLDERHNDRWFVAITVTHTVFPIGDLLQGSAWIMSLDGGGGTAEGFFYAERPTRFELLN
jgi:hypothetical protein